MPSKQAILDNVDQYSASELVDFIRNGIVTFKELCDETEGYFLAPVRKEVEQMLVGSEEEDWHEVQRANTEEAYLSFLGSYPDSQYADDARRFIKQLHQVQAQAAVRAQWDAVDKESEESLRAFINENPQDSHCNEARRIINELMRMRIIGYSVDALIEKIKAIQTDKKVQNADSVIANMIKEALNSFHISRADLIEQIKKDNNLLNAKVISLLLSDGYLGLEDLMEIGVSQLFLSKLLSGQERVQFDQPRKLDKINKICTEVYFWGIPSSGKSCALGAILSVANNGKVARSMSMDPDCQGYGYMNRLSNLFKADGKVGILPEGTSIYSTYEMGFDLEDYNGAVHPITCIDLAGELVRCMYKSDAGETLNVDEVSALDTLTRVLSDNRTTNRKIHFFVLEYGGEDRLYEGLPQSVYLAGALRYIQRTKIFEKETDGVYLMLTKVDKTGVTGDELVRVLEEYIEENYKGFYNGLEKICNDHGINGGKVERLPFSMGQVCFQDYCIFKEAPAANIVKKLLTRTKGFKNGKLQKGINIFKK